MRLFCHFLIATTLCLVGFSSLSLAADHINDNLGLFSDKTKEMVNQQIAQVYKNRGWMIAVETRDAADIANLPADKSEQDRFLTQWTTKNYIDNRLEGMYLVIFKNPSKFRFHVDTDQQKKMGVTQADINTWSNQLTDNLRSRRFDLALVNVVGSMSAKLSRGSAANPTDRPAQTMPQAKPNAQNPKPAAGEAEGPSVLMWVLIAVGVFIIFRIIRSAMSGMSNSGGYGPGGTPNQYGPGNAANMGGPGYGPQGNAPGYGGRGGGFMTGMLGGLFGGMAGNWMYDKMRGDPQSPSDSGQGHYTSHDALPDNSSAESDSTTYGGDWGSSDSGGGDYGGGDSGGGDGGGDW